MRTILCLPLFFVFTLSADEAQDRLAIDKAIGALNDPAQRASLFTKDADNAVDFDRLIDLHNRNSPLSPYAIGMSEPWTQMTVPHVVSGIIRFISKDVAMVDGASTIDGAMTLARRVPLLFVMKKEGAVWRISAVRLVSSGPPPLVIQ